MGYGGFSRLHQARFPPHLGKTLNAGIMSDMKKFTVRELNRSPRVVLAASRMDGHARISERGGQTSIISPEAMPLKQISALPDFSKRRSRLFKGVLSAATARQFDIGPL
jgi:hypothetical protein